MLKYIISDSVQPVSSEQGGALGWGPRPSFMQAEGTLVHSADSGANTCWFGGGGDYPA